MHILHLSTALTWRGGEQQIAYLQQGLRKAGVKQTVLCSSKSALLGYCDKYSLNRVHTPKKGSISWAYAKLIKQLVDEHNISIIHIHDSHAHNNAIVAAVFLKVKVPMVLHRRVDFAVSNSILSKYKYNYSGNYQLLGVFFING